MPVTLKSAFNVLPACQISCGTNEICINAVNNESNLQITSKDSVIIKNVQLSENVSGTVIEAANIVTSSDLCHGITGLTNNQSIQMENIEFTESASTSRCNISYDTYDGQTVSNASQLKTNIQCNNEITIMVWNIQGLGDKLVNCDFLKYISKYDVIIFLETMKLDSYIPNTGDFTYKHFQRRYQHPRARKPSGGIGILIKSSLFYRGVVTIVSNSDFSVWLRIKEDNLNEIYLAGVYIPPLDSTSTISSFKNNNAFHVIQEEITHFSEKGQIAICGDFNARTGLSSDYIKDLNEGSYDILNIIPSISIPKNEFPITNRYSIDQKINKYGKELLALCKTSNLRIMNGYFADDKNTGVFTCYTAQGKSLIDYLICDFEFYNKLQTFETQTLNTYSDHCALTFKVELAMKGTNQNPNHNNRKQKLNSKYYRYVFNQDFAVGLLTTINEIKCTAQLEKFIESVIADKGVNDAVSNIYSFIEIAISENFSKKYLKAPSDRFPRNEWFDDECKYLKRLANDFPKSNDINIEENFEQFMSLKKSYKATIQRKKRQYQSSIRNKLDSLQSKNPQDYWKMWDKLNKNNTCSAKSNISLECFENYFASIQSPPHEASSKFDFQFLKHVQNILDDACYSEQTEIFMTDQPICTSEVQFALKSLKLGKAPGIDGISNEFYKLLSNHLIEPLTTLFNYIFEKGVYPDRWSEGIIQPLHKKGGHNEPDNYRKLTLMACMGKIFESIINKRLIFQSEATDNNDPYQFGFSKGFRTSDNVFILDTLISYHRSKRKALFVTFIDFSKAFDFVNRTFLYYKMFKKGYGGRLIKIIESMFAKSNARVRWHGELGNNIDSTYGVLQGGIVSPKLFNLYLSDMCQYLDQGCGVTINDITYTHLLYADDLVLISETANGMNTLLKNLEFYCRKWHLIINSQKTKVLIFSKPSQTRISDNFKFVIENDELEVVDSYKYLGHVLSNSKNVHNEMYEHLGTQAQKAMFALKEKYKSTVGYLPPKLSMKMFDTLIMSILEYNSEIWFPLKEVEILEKIQMVFLKNMLGVRSKTSNLAVLADTGRFPLKVRQQISAIRYLERIKSNNCPSILLKNCYDIQNQLFQKSVNCWLSRLHKVTDSLGINLNDNVNKIICTFYDKTHQKMLADINNSNLNPKLRTYKLFKSDIRLEPYLNFNLPKYLYCNIARLRLSSHNLNIELGRHKRPYVPAENRLCNKCDLNKVEDEFHCMMICKKWQQIRIKLITEAVKYIEGFLVLDPSEQFTQILKNKNVDMIVAIGKFLHEAIN